MLGEVECPDLTAFFRVSGAESRWGAKEIEEGHLDLHLESQTTVERQNVDIIHLLRPRRPPSPNEHPSQRPPQRQRTLRHQQ